MASHLDHHYWLVTWTTFGSWLPGDHRGSTSPVWIGGRRARLNTPSTPAAPPIPPLQRWARRQRGDPEIHLTSEDAEVLIRQFRETVAVRGWLLVSVAIMHNHVHLIVGADGTLDPSDFLRDFKRYGSRALNVRDRTPGRRWWTKSGSRRRLRAEANVLAAVAYVRDQYEPLLVWADAEWTSR